MLSNEWNPRTQKPPTDSDRLVLFSDLVNQYEVATRSLRDKDTDASSFSEDLAHGRMVRAGLLRKFFLGKDKEVHLNQVISSLRNSPHTAPFLGNTDIKSCNRLLNQFEELPDLAGSVSVPIYEAEPTWSSWEIFHFVAYGNVLHADYGKWRTTRTYGTWFFMASLAKTVHHLEELLFSLAKIVDDAIDKHNSDSLTL